MIIKATLIDILNPTKLRDKINEIIARQNELERMMKCFVVEIEGTAKMFDNAWERE